jgi:hypothetical protein
MARVDSSAAIRRRVEPVAKRSRRAQQTLREECRVDERLTIAREIESVGRGWVHCARDGTLRERRVLFAQPSFRGSVVGERCRGPA